MEDDARAKLAERHPSGMPCIALTLRNMPFIALCGLADN